MLPLSSRRRLCNYNGVPVVWNLENQADGRALGFKATSEQARLNVAEEKMSSKLSVVPFGGLTSSWMYWMRKGEALRLSTGKLKKPWISFW